MPFLRHPLIRINIHIIFRMVWPFPGVHKWTLCWGIYYPYIYVHARTCSFVCLCVYAHMDVCVRVLIWACVCMWACACMFFSVYACVCTSQQINPWENMQDQECAYVFACLGVVLEWEREWVCKREWVSHVHECDCVCVDVITYVCRIVRILSKIWRNKTIKSQRIPANWRQNVSSPGVRHTNQAQPRGLVGKGP